MSKSSGGEVTYELTADDSNLESDLYEAGKKVEKLAKKTADKSVEIEEEKTETIEEEIINPEGKMEITEEEVINPKEKIEITEEEIENSEVAKKNKTSKKK